MIFIWKSLANHLTRDQKVVIHGNSCIIIFISILSNWWNQDYNLVIPDECAFICQITHTLTLRILSHTYCVWSKLKGRFVNLINFINVCATWASCHIRKIAGAHAPGMPGTFSPSPHVSDPDMHHGTCITHVPWCMPESLTSGFLWNRRRGETFPAFSAHAQPAILRIW